MNNTTIAAANSSPAPPMITAPAHWAPVNGPMRIGSDFGCGRVSAAAPGQTVRGEGQRGRRARATAAAASALRGP